MNLNAEFVLCYVTALQQKKKTNPVILQGYNQLYLLETRKEKANIQAST